MRELGIEGVIRGRRRRTTIPEPAAPRPPDPVNRRFTAERPNQLWLADLTHSGQLTGLLTGPRSSVEREGHVRVPRPHKEPLEVAVAGAGGKTLSRSSTPAWARG
ncbi:hypothetical protein OG871_01530 [Kitasatospora sp. NBC_00374]|uniref:hypothetical protein n=1 Tax=Kitasatospora sp. NBC_00374 TaxID=2975964 RepID=UPI0030E2E630